MTATDLPAGRELDALIAEKVMGWRPAQGGVSMVIGDKDDLWEDGSRKWYGKDGDLRPMRLLPVPHYSTDIAAAWLVVEKMRSLMKIGTMTVDLVIKVGVSADGAFVEIFEHSAMGYVGQDLTFDYQVTDAPTAPLAICRAALKAVAA